MLGGDIVGAVAVAPETWTWLRRFTPAGSSAVFASLTACPPSGAGANVVGAVIGSLAGPGGSEPVDVIVADLARFLDGIAAGRVLPCCGGFRATRCTSIPASPELFDPFGHRETTVACADDRGNELRRRRWPRHRRRPAGVGEDRIRRLRLAAAGALSIFSGVA